MFSIPFEYWNALNFLLRRRTQHSNSISLVRTSHYHHNDCLFSFGAHISIQSLLYPSTDLNFSIVFTLSLPLVDLSLATLSLQSEKWLKNAFMVAQSSEQKPNWINKKKFRFEHYIAVWHSSSKSEDESTSNEAFLWPARHCICRYAAVCVSALCTISIKTSLITFVRTRKHSH